MCKKCVASESGETLNLIPYPQKIIRRNGVCSSAGKKKIVHKILTGADGESNSEAYELEISSDEIVITGGKEGIFYAKITLEQLSMQFGNTIPCMLIEDSPVLEYRGFMLDSCRHFVPVCDVKKIIDLISFFKMNRFHWHLTDDQGWRIEIRKYPRLTSIGSRRGRADYGKFYEPDESDGFYSTEDIREVVEYASKRSVVIVPEIEIPGHETAMLAAYPEYGCSGSPMPDEAGTLGGIYQNLICAGKEESISFLKDILDEVMILFPGKDIHIGGDEAVKANWRACPDCQRRMHSLGLKDENELQQWLIIRMSEYLKSKGRRAVCWNDSLRGNELPKDFLVQFWNRDHAAIADFASRGGKIIQSDNRFFYIDYPYAINDLESILNAKICPDFISPLDRANVIGLETPLWTERVVDLDRAAFLMLPRIPAAGECAWTDSKTRNENNTNNSFSQRFRGCKAYAHGLGMWEAPEEYWKMDGELKQHDLDRYTDSLHSKGNIKATNISEEYEKIEESFYGKME